MTILLYCFASSCAAIHKSSPDSSDAPEPTDLGLHEIWCDVFHNEKLRQESFSKYETNSDEIKQKLLKFAKQGFVYRRKEIICYWLVSGVIFVYSVLLVNKFWVFKM